LKRPNTLFIGQVLHHLPQVASTNAHAISLLSKSKPPEGTVISTFCQADGRGQFGSTWESEPGKNISLSILLYPEFLEVRHQFRLSQAISLAVRDLVATHLGAGVKIKWPNDIYVGDRKIAGILIQNSLQNNMIRSTVAGIGININQTVFLTNPPNPTSFSLHTSRSFDLEELIASLCTFSEQRYLQLKSGKIVLLQQDYLQHLYRLGTPGFFQKNTGDVFQGTVTGVDETGRLRVIVHGNEEVFDLKEIKFLMDDGR